MTDQLMSVDRAQDYAESILSRWAKTPDSVPGIEAGANPGKSLAAVDYTELLQHSFPVREPVLAPVFTLGSLNMLFSYRGIGKTHFGLGVAFAAAAGGEFLGWQAPRPYRVLYIDGEMPGEALQTRIAAIVADADKTPDPDYLRFLTIDLQGGVMPDLSTVEGQGAIQDECNQADAIILDNLSCLVRGDGRENGAETWHLVAEWALRLRSAGKCVIFVHHAGKDGRQRGTSKREDLLDVSISLKRPPDYQDNQGARFEVRFDKGRHLKGSEGTPFEAWLQADEHGRPVWTKRTIAETTADAVASLANDGLSQTEIALELGIHKSSVCRAYRQAVQDGRIAKKESAKPGRKEKTYRADLDG